jgi:hypothetical protein
MVAARADGHGVEQELVANLTSKHVLERNIGVAEMSEHASID